MKSLTAHPGNKEQLNALKKLFKAFNIPFDIKKAVVNAAEKQEVDKDSNGEISLT